jgi:hypothetical protein
MRPISLWPWAALTAALAAGIPACPAVLPSSFNCHTLALEVPITFLTGTAQIPGASDASRVLGFWTTASRPRITVLGPGWTSSSSGGFVQVSRAGAGALVPGDITVGDCTGSRLQSLNTVNLGDGVDANTDSPFLARFPFVATPTDGVTPRYASESVGG